MAHVVGLKRFALNHLGGTALALSLTVSVVTAVATLSITGDLHDPRGGSSSVQPRTTLDSAAFVRLFGAKWPQGATVAPHRAAVEAQALAEYAQYNPEEESAASLTLELLLLECAQYNGAVSNIIPGDDISSIVVGSTRIRFLEDNTFLLEAAPVGVTATEILLRRQNLLPGDDQLLLPAYGQYGATDY